MKDQTKQVSETLILSTMQISTSWHRRQSSNKKNERQTKQNGISFSLSAQFNFPIFHFARTTRIHKPYSSQCMYFCTMQIKCVFVWQFFVIFLLLLCAIYSVRRFRSSFEFFFLVQFCSLQNCKDFDAKLANEPNWNHTLAVYVNI